ncbi:hypothetical protein F4677DRAFT_457693 [Hypoxylon crocopeplum]|nr:hypothetical protein F4677DRAFT_457693 [Hypoxylon crocopeplum]
MTKFEVQCTLPPSAVTYVSAPNARGTLDIVWSCLGILLICTWSILHLNVPLQTTPSRKREKYLRGGFRVSNSIMWMLLNVLAPEWSLGKAWADYRAVCSVEADFNALKDEDGVPWTRMHTYLANLGGFTIKFEELTAPAPQPEGWVLDANQLLLARQFGIIEKLPAILEDDVSDRNKGDLFVKVIALSQVLWFVVQLIVRLSWRVPTSQLEIMTLAFAVCTAFTYILLLDKPKDVRYSVTVRAVRYATPQELIRLALAGPTMYAYSRRGIAIPNNAIHADRNRSGERFNLELLHGVTFSIAIFGAVHCVAWEFIFPNDIEQRLWQASSIVTAATIPTAFILLALHQYVWRWFCFEKTFAGFVKSPRSVISGNVIVFFFGISFCIARLFILVEVFRSLAFLPPEAFATTWANVLPHIG